MSKSKYVKPSLKSELMKKIEQFIDDYPERGYRSMAQFIEDAVRRRADELRVFELTPRFEHFNCKEDHVTIHDKKLGRWVDVYFTKDGKIHCEYCETNDCEHVKFVLSNPQIMKTLRKRGWTYKGETRT